jgi:hypothetical protein
MDEISTLIDEYAGGAWLLRDAMRRAGGVDLDARPIEGKWSIREVVCHLADAEILYADRMKRVLAEENPTFFEADPNLFGAALNSRQRSIDTELAVVEAVRAHMVPILRACDAARFHRTGVHSRVGQMTLRTLLERITGHVPHHVAYIDEKVRRLST